MKKTALVSGADGFIGSHLTEFLLSKGWDVKAFCAYNPHSSLGWLDTYRLRDNVPDNLSFILGDIRDFKSVYEAMDGCSIVFHLAALIGIPYSYKAPLSYIETNVIGTYNILEAAKLLQVEKLVVTSTSETYGTAQYVPIDENHPLVGQSPYSASKIAADQLAISYFTSFDCPVSILRPFNTYGPRQSSRAVIPTIIKQIASGKSEIALGSLTPTRDFNYVEDTCSAFYHVAQKGLPGEVYNSASNFEISIGDLVLEIGNVMDKDVSVKLDNSRVRPAGSEVMRLFGDNSKLKKHTDWYPQFGGLDGFRNGLQKTCTWFVSNSSNFSSLSYDI